MIRAHAGVPVIPQLLLGKVVMRDETELKIACVLVTAVLHFFSSQVERKIGDGENKRSRSNPPFENISFLGS